MSLGSFLTRMGTSSNTREVPAKSAAARTKMREKKNVRRSKNAPATKLCDEFQTFRAVVCRGCVYPSAFPWRANGGTVTLLLPVGRKWSEREKRAELLPFSFFLASSFAGDETFVWKLSLCVSVCLSVLNCGVHCDETFSTARKGKRMSRCGEGEEGGGGEGGMETYSLFPLSSHANDLILMPLFLWRISPHETHPFALLRTVD